MSPETLATLHALCFEDAPRPWSAAEIASLLAEPATLLEAHPDGFALARTAGPEAELLTLAIAPPARRRGLARGLLAAVEDAAAARGALEIFLEVAETNAPARALYAAAGYASAGFRRDYYGPAGGRRVGALVLRKALGPPRDTAAGAAGDND